MVRSFAIPPPPRYRAHAGGARVPRRWHARDGPHGAAPGRRPDGATEGRLPPRRPRSRPGFAVVRRGMPDPGRARRMGRRSSAGIAARASGGTAGIRSIRRSGREIGHSDDGTAGFSPQDIFAPKVSVVRPPRPSRPARRACRQADRAGGEAL